MTVIAYKHGQLAVDSLGTCGDTTFTAKKFRMHDKYVMATTGNLARGIEVMNWYESGADPEKWPASQSTPDWARLIVLNENGCFEYEDRPIAIEVRGPYRAWGAGREAAMGAMYIGATAERAIYAAISCISGCGGEVHVFKLRRGKILYTPGS